MNIVVDLDGVICTEEKTFDRALAKEIDGARDALVGWRIAGHTVTIYTARSWAEYRMTSEWLKDHRMPYDILMMGKPVYDVWIDDRAIRFTGWDSVRI